MSKSLIALFLISPPLFAAAPTPKVTPMERLTKLVRETPNVCSKLDEEVSGFRGSGKDPAGFVIPEKSMKRAMEIMTNCRKVPEEPSLSTIKLIGSAIMEHQPTAEPLVESLLTTECISQCVDVAMALANSKQASAAKKVIHEYLMKPKLPAFNIPKKQNELIRYGAQKGLWKLGKIDEAQLTKIDEAMKKAEIDFHPPTASAVFKGVKGQTYPTKHPKFMEELQTTIRMLETHMKLAQALN